MLDSIIKYWAPFYAVLSMVFFGIVWAMRKTYATQESVDNLDRRISSTESDIKRLPTDKDMHQLELRLVQVSSQMDGVSQQLVKLQRTTEMLLENELKEGKQ